MCLHRRADTLERKRSHRRKRKTLARRTKCTDKVRHQNLSTFRRSAQSRRHNDRHTEVAAGFVHQGILYVYTYSYLDRIFLIAPQVMTRHTLLDRRCAFDGVDRTIECGHDTVAGVVDQGPSVNGKSGLDDVE